MQVRKKDSGEIFAMKILRKDQLLKRDQIMNTQLERSILQKTNHPFLVGLKFAFQTDDKLYMVMDYAAGGELFHHLQQERRFSEDRVRLYAAEIVLGLGFLHSQGIVYRYEVITSRYNMLSVAISCHDCFSWDFYIFQPY